jgi:hypothetical protein
MNFFFDRRPLTSLDEALNHYEPGEFQSPTRSTIMLLSLLKYRGEVWRRLEDHIATSEQTCEAHLEFRVDPKKGTGKASHTDAMLISGDRAIAIEAKWTEPRYEQVAVWLGQGSNAQNRRDVMNGWLSLLEPHATKKCCLEDFSSAVYQIVHRAASACSAGRSPALLYLQFSPLPDGRAVESCLIDDLRHLYLLLGAPVGFPFWLCRVEAKPMPAFEGIKNLPRGVPQTGEEVRAALRREPLFTFTDVSFIPVKKADRA